jgi:transcription elongation factor GreB
MSKAFTKDDDSEAPLFVAPRAFLPEGVPNYVTERGLALLREEERALESERQRLLREGEHKEELLALAERQHALAERIDSAALVNVSEQPRAEVRFGATVKLRYESGSERAFRIVGVDEANPSEGKLAFTSPLAKALLGAKVGSVVGVRTPSGEEEIEVLSIAYASS